MKEKVKITVKGLQNHNGNPDKIEMTTTGARYNKKEKIYITYIDTSIDISIETNTAIKIEPGRVTVTRYGAVTTSMVFDEDKAHITSYQTPMGVFDLKIKTKSISVNDLKGQLHLKIHYDISVNGMPEGEAYFELLVEDANQ